MKVIRIIFTIAVIAIAAAVVLNRDNVHSLLPEKYNILERLQKMISEPSEAEQAEQAEQVEEAEVLDLVPLEESTPADETLIEEIDSTEQQLPAARIDSLERDTVTM